MKLFKISFAATTGERSSKEKEVKTSLLYLEDHLPQGHKLVNVHIAAGVPSDEIRVYAYTEKESD